MSSYSDVWLLISEQITTSSLFSFAMQGIRAENVRRERETSNRAEKRNATQGKLPKNVRREQEEGDCAEERDATQGIRAENVRREQGCMEKAVAEMR